MKYRKLIPIFLAAVALFGFSGNAHAAYIEGNFIDDQYFVDYGSMSKDSIQSFLNSKGGALASQSFSTESNGTQTAAWIISYTAFHIGISPKVLLATIQKEQSLVTDPSPAPSQYNFAMGYGCPDSGTCSFPGFYSQLMNGAWQLRFNYERAGGNNSSWTSPSGDQWGNASIQYACKGVPGVPAMPAGGYSPGTDYGYYRNNSLFPNNAVGWFSGAPDRQYTSAVVANKSSASLYCYTPHAYKSGLYSGSFNFVSSYESWFGPTHTPAWGYGFVSASQSTLSLDYGQRTTGTIVLKNTGSITWYADGSVPAGSHPVRLAMANYQNTPFTDTSDPAWLGTQNQIVMTPSSVSPGENATFTFKMLAPFRSLSSYSQKFIPVVDGVGFMTDMGMSFNLSSNSPKYSYVSAAFPPASILSGQKIAGVVTLKNTGNGPWYADGSVPPGEHPLRLAALGYQQNLYASPDDPNWLGTRNQVKMTPAVVSPNESATFTFGLVGPYTQVNGYSFRFLPVLDGITMLADYGMAFSLSTPSPIYSYSVVSAINPPSVMSVGSTAQATLVLRNTGNTIWYNETTRGHQPAVRLVMSSPWYGNSPFYTASDPAWLTQAQISMSTSEVAPGASGIFTFTWKAPLSAGNYTQHFAPVLDGRSLMQDIGMAFATTVTP